jgi:hypothetical protein
LQEKLPGLNEPVGMVGRGPVMTAELIRSLFDHGELANLLNGDLHRAVAAEHRRKSGVAASPLALGGLLALRACPVARAAPGDHSPTDTLFLHRRDERRRPSSRCPSWCTFSGTRCAAVRYVASGAKIHTLAHALSLVPPDAPSTLTRVPLHRIPSLLTSDTLVRACVHRRAQH